MITSKGLIKLGFEPSIDFSLRDDGNGTYIAKWFSDKPKPTTADIEAAHIEWKTQYDAQEYSRNRKAEYAPIGDQLDAILKWANLMRMDGTNLPEDLDQTIAQWLSVKQKYPKS